MIVKAGSTDVTTYVVLRKAADGTELTGATITNIDLVYTRSGADHVAKVDATALAAADSAHADNKAIEVDATSAPGLYRVDWPDAAFAVAVREVILTVIYATALTVHLRVELSPQVDTVAISGDTVAADNCEADYDGTGYVGGTIKKESDMVSIHGTALTETATQLAGAFTKFFDKAAPTGTINSIPDAVAGANGGLLTTNGTKVSQTVDLTAGQSIACSDKTGFSLSATGADLILKTSTFVVAIAAAINELATYGLTALNTLLVTTGIKAASVPAVVLANSASHGGAAAVVTLLTPIAATVPNTQKVDVETIKTQAVTCAAGVTVLPSVGAASAQTATLDTIKAETASILTDTAEIGVAGVGLSAVPDLSGVTTLLTRLSATRATYLDYLFSIYFGMVSAVAQAQAGAAGSVTLAAGASATNDFYKGQIIVIYTGTGAGQARACYGYTGATKVALTRPNWVVNPDNTSWYVIITAGSAVVAAMDDIDFGVLQKVSLNAATPAVTVSDKTGFKLSSDGADLVACDVATVGDTPTLLLTKIQAIWNRLFTKKTVTATTETAYEKDDTTAMEIFTLADDDTTASRTR